MPRSLVAFCLCALMLLPSLPTHAYTFRYNNTASAAQRWNVQPIPVAISTSLSSPPGNVTGGDVVGAVRRALARWEAAANIRFVEVSSANLNAAQDNVNLITIADTPENRAAFVAQDGTVREALGIANNYFTPTGEIVESDIVINHNVIPRLGRQHRFSTDGVTGFDLETTFAHEIGHLLGLGHSAVVGATMNASQAENPIYGAPATTARILAEDDCAGARAIYGAPQGTGAITGTITNAGTPVFGAHVWAEDVSTGRIAAGNVTLSDGSYRIGGLLPGTYRLAVESLDGLVSVANIRSGNSVYNGAGSTIRTFEAPGTTSVSSNTTATVPFAITDASAVSVNPRYLGLLTGDGLRHTAQFAIPFTAGETRTIYVWGTGLDAIDASGVTIGSPYFSIDQTSFRRSPADENINGEVLKGLRFEVTARPDAPGGEYSIRLQSNAGEIAYVPGALTIESSQCAQTISQASRSFASEGGTGSVNVTSTSGCAWTASSNASFIAVTSGGSGNGGGTVTYSVAANTSASPRTGTLTIAGQTFTVTQDGTPAPPPPSGQIVLLTEEGTNNLIAVDSVTLVGAPLPVVTESNFSLDRRTRVMFFSSNLASAGNISVYAEDSAGRSFQMPIEFVDAVPGFSALTQIVVRIPDGLSGGDVWVRADAGGRQSNRVLLRLKPAR